MIIPYRFPISNRHLLIINEKFLKIVPCLLHFIDSVPSYLVIDNNKQRSQDHLGRTLEMGKSSIIIIQKLSMSVDLCPQGVVRLPDFFYDLP